ncbi:hypothetical protein GO730_00245 [Spirosoma sp. HMF3257]|uniref:Uncharacterized protein n=1 Tax=Spirosoma telluris TaxID=2183553 RepID=A0A327NH07_9BACT|nr:hypothetical protein [Spirosoma telluris]RAI73236.1 hypothetical protein HMF3257_00240 [Spirosoma telluris]
MFNPQPPANSPLGELMLAESRFVALTAESGKQQITDEFTQLRELLWQLIVVAPDSAPYAQSWNLINIHAKIDLMDFEQGNQAALSKVQEKVKGAVQMLP